MNKKYSTQRRQVVCFARFILFLIDHFLKKGLANNLIINYTTQRRMISVDLNNTLETRFRSEVLR